MPPTPSDCESNRTYFDFLIWLLGYSKGGYTLKSIVVSLILALFTVTFAGRTEIYEELGGITAYFVNNEGTFSGGVEVSCFDAI